MTNGVVPYSAGIDTLDAIWEGGFSHTKGWLDICEYKLHLISSTIGSSVIVPLTADFLQLQIYRTIRDVHSRVG